MSSPAPTPWKDVATRLGETRQLAQALHRGEASTLDVGINDARLRDLIRDIGRANHRPETPTGLRTREFAVCRETRERTLVAEAPMAFCPESALIVHGPIILGRVLALSERLLPRGVHPMALEGVRLRRPVTDDLEIRIGVAAMDSNEGPAPVTGTVRDSEGRAWPFSCHPRPRTPVSRWIDNREVEDLFAITAAASAPVRRFTVGSRGLRTPFPGRAEAVQLLLEAVIRAVVIHRNRDGRAILLAGLDYLSWPEDLVPRLVDCGTATVDATPGQPRRPGSPWHPLDVTLSGVLGSGTLNFVEARTSITALFR